MSYLENLETRELVLLATDIRHDYHKARDKFYHKSKNYYNQSISSSYHKEDDLIVMLKRCENLKNQYADICEVLKGRGIRPVVDGWRDSNNDLFVAKDILHSA